MYETPFKCIIMVPNVVCSQPPYHNQTATGPPMPHPPRSQYGNQGSQYGNPGSQYGNQGSQYGNQGSQYGNQGSQYGNQGSQYGNQGSQYGNQGYQGFSAPPSGATQQPPNRATLSTPTGPSRPPRSQSTPAAVSKHFLQRK
jgi:hypothetical protein